MKQVRSKVGKIRETKDGKLLLEQVKGSKLEDVSVALRTAVGDRLNLRELVPKVLIELRDLKDAITKEKVKEAITTTLEKSDREQIVVKMLRADPEGTRVAFVLAPRAVATDKILKPGKVMVGWVNAYAREKKLITRCYKCLEYGHNDLECPKKGHQEKLCYRCGGAGYLAAGCE